MEEEGWYNKFVLKRFNNELYTQNTNSNSLFNIKTQKQGSLNEFAFFKLKTLFDFNEKCIVVDNISEKFDKNIYGNALPKTIEELGGSGFVSESNFIEDELNWFFLSLRKYEDEVSNFINLKNEFDNNLLLGNYDKALIILNKIDEEVCISLWGIENRLLLGEMIDGLEENKLFLSKVNALKKSGAIVSLADFLSKRAEKDLSANRFKNEISNSLNRVKGNYRDETIDYYLFKINYHELKRSDNLCSINSIEFQNSIIDRYLTFLRLLQNYILNDDIDIGDDKKEMLKSRLYYASKKLPEDSRIENMRLYLDPKINISNKRIDISAVNILDVYTQGDYQKTLEKLKPFLYNNPNLFEFYEIYAKCLLNLDYSFEPLNDDDNFQNSILKEVFVLLQKKNHPEFTAQNLIKISLQLESLSISSQIVNFVSVELKKDYSFEKLSLLNSNFINPVFSKIYNNNKLSNVYFKKLNQIFSNSETINFLYLKTNNLLKDSVSGLKISENRKNIYIAKFLQKEKKYDEAIIYWTELKRVNKKIPHLYESIIVNLFKCFFESRKLDDCVKLLVETYFTNPNFIIRLDSIKVVDEIRLGRFRNISKNIYLPLFYWITNGAETAICNTYELFLASYGAKTPTEFIKDLPKDIERNLLVYFLKNVCNIETFKHSIHIDGSEQRLQERLNICKFLEEFDNENSTVYIEEVLVLEKQDLVQKGLQEYDESKIFINKKMIINSLLKELEADFRRYLKLDSVIGDRSVLLMSPQGINSVTIKQEGKNSNNDSPFSESPLLDMVREMFNEVRSKFLSSEYGLVAYLSTRIRHGVFEGEVRPQFEKLNLMTEKDSDTGIYEANDYWSSLSISFNEDVKTKMQALLANFSHEIDGQINTTVKKNLQIKLDDENPEGWFNYNFHNELIDQNYNTNNLSMTEFYLKVKGNDDFNYFVDSCFELLWKKTDLNLKEIKENLKRDTINKFEGIIENLEVNLLKLINKNDLPELFQNITTSRVNVQNDINRIARWFNRSGTQIKDFKINKVVEITKENTNKHYEGKNKSIILTENIDADILIKGEYLPYLIDLMKIFFDNILKHTNQINGAVPTEIEIKINEKDNLLYLNIQNDLFGDIESEKENIENYLNKFEADVKKALAEINSGFHKAIRILKSDLGAKDNEIKIGTNDYDKFYIKCIINTNNLKK